MQYINDIYCYLGDWCVSECGYVFFFLVEIECNGYGDCKDLVIFFVVMFKVVGIKVELILVSCGDVVWDLLVFGMYVLNYVIVCVEVDGKIWWLDLINLVFVFGCIMFDIQQCWVLVLGVDGKVWCDEIFLEVFGDILCVICSEYYIYDGEVWVELCVEFFNVLLMQFSVVDCQCGCISIDQDLCCNFVKEGSDCVLECDDSQFVLLFSYMISVRFIDCCVFDWFGGEYFYNCQDLVSQWDVFVKYCSEGQLVELYLGELQIMFYDISLFGGKIDELVYSCEICSFWFDIDLQVELVKDGGYYYCYWEVQKISWFNYDEINSVEFGKLIEQSCGCVE